MAFQFLTQVGTRGIGQTLNREPMVGVPLVYDLLLRAARHGSTVSILCGTLRPAFREVYYKHATGVLFADSLREVLKAGRHVRIMVWNILEDTLIADSVKELLIEQKRFSYAGKLEIRFSGTRALAEKIPHFSIAHGPDFWGLRLEDPHPYPPIDAPVTDKFPQMEAVVVFGREAEEDVRALLATFDTLFDAAGR